MTFIPHDYHNFLERKFKIQAKFKITAYCFEKKRQVYRFTRRVIQFYLNLLFTQNIFITQHMFILYSTHTSDLNSPGALFILALVVTIVVSDNKYSGTVVYTRLTKINTACLLFL